MKVLVTGVCGFIGMHTAKKLLDRGDEVCGLDNLNDYYEVALKEARLAQLTARPGFDFERLDISDRTAVPDFFLRHKPQRVIHLAAQAGVRYSVLIPRHISIPTWSDSATFSKRVATAMWNIWLTRRPVPSTGPTPNSRSPPWKITWTIR